MDGERLAQLYVPPTQVVVSGFKARFYKKGPQARVYVLVSLDDTLRRASSANSEKVRVEKEGEAVWEWRFSGTVNSFGSADRPATAAIELWTERPSGFSGFSIPFRDICLGSVSVPLLKFADGVANEFKLPVFAAQSTGSDPEALIDFTIQTSMDINKMMTEDEIDAKFQALNLPNDGLTPRDLSAAEKYSQIVDFQKRKDENEKRNVERNKPSHFVDLLREDKMRDFDWKRIKFNMTNVHWQQEFLDLNGLDLLFYALGKQILSLKSRVIPNASTDYERVSSLLLCLQRILSFVFGNTSLHLTHDMVDLLFQSLDLVDDRSKLQDKLLVFDILKMLLNSVHARVTLESLANAFYARPDTIDALVEEFAKGENLLFKITFLELLSFSVKKCEDRELMEELRFLFEKRGMGWEALQKVIADFPDEELLESVSQYYEHFDVNSSADASELSSEMEDIYDDLSSFSSTSSSDDDDAAEDEEESDDDGEDAIEESETQSTESEKTRAAPSLVAGEAAVDSGRTESFEVKPTLAPEVASAPPLPPPQIETPKKDKISSIPVLKDDAKASIIEGVTDDSLDSVLDSLMSPRKAPTKGGKSVGHTAGGPPPPPPGPPGPPPPPPRLGPPPPPGTPMKAAPKNKMLALRLKNIAAEEIGSTIFGDLDSLDAAKAPLDLGSLTELFTAAPDKPDGAKKGHSKGASGAAKHAESSLLDPKRRQQIAILLKRSPIAVADLRAALAALTPVNSLTRESLELLSSLFAKRNDDEIKMLVEYTGAESKLDHCERFLCGLYRIPRVLERLPLLVFRIHFPQIIAEANKSATEVADLLSRLKEPPFKLLLSYVVDVANVLRPGPKKVQGFQLSSLPKLMELKSPLDPKTTLLHFLVNSLVDKNPEPLEFAAKLVDSASAAPMAMAKFQSAFPYLIEKLFAIKGEMAETQRRIEELKRSDPRSELSFEEQFLANLLHLKTDIERASKELGDRVNQIEDDIVFFGDHESEAAEDATTREIKAMWKRLAIAEFISDANSTERARRDEDRFTFFLLLLSFISDLKRAMTFAIAKRDKEKQKQAYKDLLTAKANPEDLFSPRKDDLPPKKEEVIVHPKLHKAASVDREAVSFLGSGEGERSRRRTRGSPKPALKFPSLSSTPSSSPSGKNSPLSKHKGLSKSRGALHTSLPSSTSRETLPAPFLVSSFGSAGTLPDLTLSTSGGKKSRGRTLSMSAKNPLTSSPTNSTSPEQKKH